MRAAVLVLSLGVAVGSTPAFAGSYKYYSIGSQSENATAYGINDRDQVVGQLNSADPVSGKGLVASFVWDAGKTTVVEVPRPDGSLQLSAISDGGIGVGRYYDRRFHGWLAAFYNLATGRLLFPLRNTADVLSSELVAISNDNVAVGSATVVGAGGSGTETRPLVFRDRAPQIDPISVGGTPVTSFSGVSPGGVAWGYAGDTLFTYSGTTATAVPAPDCTQSRVSGLTNGGLFFGSYCYRSPTKNDGFTYDPRTGVVAYKYVSGTPMMLNGITADGLIGTTQSGDPSFPVTRQYLKTGTSVFDISPPSAHTVEVLGVNRHGSFVGFYENQQYQGYALVAICAADQEPCTQ